MLNAAITYFTKTVKGFTGYTKICLCFNYILQSLEFENYSVALFDKAAHQDACVSDYLLIAMRTRTSDDECHERSEMHGGIC
jgi:hypothetical protein